MALFQESEEAVSDPLTCVALPQVKTSFDKIYDKLEKKLALKLEICEPTPDP